MKKIEKNDIVVSVVCTTYNHEAYIQDSLKGFLAQETDFKYEIIVHDDASTDQTAEIVREYEKNYPDMIHGIYQKTNLHSDKNAPKKMREYVAEACRGKYIAWCEGDDYWIDRHKLQLQIDFLEQHPDYAMTAHNAIIWNYQNQKLIPMNPFDGTGTIEPGELIQLRDGNLPTASLVFRKEGWLLKSFFRKCGVGDVPTQLNCLTLGKVYYFDQIMSVYRSMHAGSWCQRMSQNTVKTLKHTIKMIKFYLEYNEYTHYAYDKYILTRIQRAYISGLLYQYQKEAEAPFVEDCKAYTCEDELEEQIQKELLRIYQQTFNENYFDERLEAFARAYDNLYIYGAGDYAGKMYAQFRKHDIKIEGFVVTEKKETGTYKGLPVFGVEELQNNDGIGIYIGINPIDWATLVDTLEAHQIRNYCCPFLLELKVYKKCDF